MAVTIKDIAQAAGVSHTTVSRALRGHPRISDETTARIQSIAGKLGYVPNTAARGLKTRRSHVLGVIVRRIDDPFLSEVLQGIEEVLREASYSLFLAASHRRAERAREIMHVMGERRVDGVIISSTQIRPEHIRRLDRFDVPLVLINNQAMDQPDVHSVYHDDAFGSEQLTRHLLQLGHQRIVFLGNEQGGKTNLERVQGFETALLKAGLENDASSIVIGPNGKPAGGAAGMKQILALPTRPTAVACFNDMMAFGAFQAIQQAGLRVPEDLSIVGFDNIELAAFTSPPLTTFHQPKYELGRKAAQMMLRVLQDADRAAVPQPEVIMLRGELRLRRSTAAPRENA